MKTLEEQVADLSSTKASASDLEQARSDTQELEARVTSVEGRATTVEQRQETLATSEALDGVVVRVTELRALCDALGLDKATVEDVGKLHGLLDELQRSLADAQAKSEELRAGQQQLADEGLEGLATRCTALEESVAALDLSKATVTTCTALEESSSALDRRLATVEAAHSALEVEQQQLARKAELESLTAECRELKNHIDELQASGKEAQVQAAAQQATVQSIQETIQVAQEAAAAQQLALGTLQQASDAHGQAVTALQDGSTTQLESQKEAAEKLAALGEEAKALASSLQAVRASAGSAKDMEGLVTQLAAVQGHVERLQHDTATLRADVDACTAAGKSVAATVAFLGESGASKLDVSLSCASPVLCPHAQRGRISMERGGSLCRGWVLYTSEQCNRERACFSDRGNGCAGRQAAEGVRLKGGPRGCQ